MLIRCSVQISQCCAQTRASRGGTAEDLAADQLQVVAWRSNNLCPATCGFRSPMRQLFMRQPHCAHVA